MMQSSPNSASPRQGKPASKYNSDICGCCVGCYPNGLVSLLMAQVLILLGFILSAMSMIDCQFVQADVFAMNSTPPDNDTAWAPGDQTGFGFILYQDSTGNCIWEDSFEDDDHHNNSDGKDFNSTEMDEFEDQIVDYLEWLGDDWERPRYCIGAAIGAAFVVFAWVIGMMCTAHTRVLRILVAAIPFFLIMPLQLASLSILTSDFCKERNCTLDRSGVAAICAGFMYFAAGIALVFTKNFARKENDTLEPAVPESQRQQQQQQPPRSPVPHEPAAIEMVDIVEDASFVIEDDRARANTNQAEEVVIGDGLAEATEIKAEMIFLHQDGEELVLPSPPAAAAPTAAAVIPTVTDVHVLDELSKTKVAP